MKTLEIFKNNQFGEIRLVLTEKGEPLFSIPDLCKSLNITNPTQVTNRLDPDEVVKIDINNPMQNIGRDNQLVGNSLVNFATESGMYSIIIRSNSPIAKPIQKWITSEVLPSIRKHGAYMTPDTIEKVLTDPDTIIKLATTLKEEKRKNELLQERNNIQEEVIAKQAPKVEYHDKVLQSKSNLTTTIVAKELGFKSAQALNKALQSRGIMFKQRKTWVLYSKYAGKGYTKTDTHQYKDEYDVIKTNVNTVWTEKGRKFLYEIFGANIELAS